MFSIINIKEPLILNHFTYSIILVDYKNLCLFKFLININDDKWEVKL